MKLSPGVYNRELSGVPLGSFWAEGISEGGKPVVESLREISACSNLYRELDNTRALWQGDTRRVLEKYTHRFDPRDVVQLGADLQKRILDNSGSPSAPVWVVYRPDNFDPTDNPAMMGDEQAEAIIQAENGLFLLFNDPAADGSLLLTARDLYPKYLIPFPADIDPVAILGPRDLVAGLDFQKGDGWLLFHEAPDVLFPDRRILMRVAHTQQRSALSYTMQLDGVFSSGFHVARYLRDMQSVRSLQLAIAETAGAAIIPWTSVLQRIQKHGSDTIYTFKDGIVRVWYPHTPLVVGVEYAAESIVGDVVSITGDTGEADWWRSIDWTPGLSLDGICPFKNLSLVDADVIVSTSAGHVVFPIAGPTETVDLFWTHARNSAIANGYPLSGLLTNGDTINPIDFVFENLLGPRALLVHIDAEALGYHHTKNAVDFLNREKPVGSIIIRI